MRYMIMSNKELVEVIDGLKSLLLFKRKAYGNSFNNAPDILHMLYPDGINVEDYEDLLTIVRVIDKLYRIANKADTEDPWMDIAGYAILSLEKKSANKNDTEIN